MVVPIVEFCYEEHMRFLLFAIVRFYKIAVNTKLVNTELLLLEEIKTYLVLLPFADNVFFCKLKVCGNPGQASLLVLFFQAQMMVSIVLATSIF